ncbi:MAG: sel1 repeat family protein [Gammaproteobacteria bacterium]|nr:sel1 repeat family protein [Gammaproteobacteria bacterium]MBU2478681.1 sel1 repeat family protein [Gammaproteobacteria bacterium]
MTTEDPMLRRAVTALEKGDFETSFVLTEALAIDGDALAQHFLGWHYHKGLGIPVDDIKAVFWWQLAAKQGIPEAQQGLGWAYENGRGTDRDLEHAYYWYTRAVAGGDRTARESLMTISPQLSSEQIKRVEQLALEQAAET